MLNTKKIFIIVSILLFLVIATLVVYNLFFKSSTPSQTTQPTNSSSAGQAGTNKAANSDLKIKPISQEKALNPVIGSDGQTVKYYSQTNGHVWQSDFEGKNIQETSKTDLNNIIKVLWSPDKEKVIGLFNENNKLRKYFYDYNSNQAAPLNENIGYVTWSPDSKQIAYQYSDLNEEQSTISLANPDGTQWKNIFKTRLNNLVVEWPIKEKISLRSPVSGLASGIIYALNPSTGNFTKILGDLFGLNAKWSPKADKLLYSFTNDSGTNPRLMLADEQGIKTKDLKLSGLADKCVWSNDDKTIICALPQEFSINAVWPDDYYKGMVTLKDDFYKIDLEANEKIKIAGSTGEISYDAQDLFLSPKEDYLFFVNRKDGLLYRLKL